MTKHPDQWTLGQLIDALEKAKPKLIFHGYASLYVDEIQSYRGFYEDLAIGATTEFTEGCYDGTAFLEYVKACEGREFEGYKGGDYTATRNTPLWIANWGMCGDTIVTGLHVDGEFAYILGKWIGGAA